MAVSVYSLGVTNGDGLSLPFIFPLLVGIFYKEALSLIYLFVTQC